MKHKIPASTPKITVRGAIRHQTIRSPGITGESPDMKLKRGFKGK
nr:MAG TPA: hypothetical protein [Caudoviricetes sp.]